MENYCQSCEIPKEKCPKERNEFLQVGRSALPAGYILNNTYQINGVLGMGGLAVTYSACSYTEPVSIKEYNPMRENLKHLDAQREKKKFVDEGRRLQQIHHKNVVQVKAVMMDAEHAYIVMEYLDGETLKDYISRSGKLTEVQMIHLMAPVLDACEAVHQAGMIHRDIKPSNLMLCQEGIKLIDFGSARKLEEHTKTIFLSENFAPPEQYDVHGRQGAWTDVYALCATMYYLLTGEAPQDARSRLKADTLLPPEKITSHISSALMKGLALRSEERWQSMDELRRALRIGPIVPADIQIVCENKHPTAYLTYSEHTAHYYPRPEEGQETMAMKPEETAAASPKPPRKKKSYKRQLRTAGIVCAILAAVLAGYFGILPHQEYRFNQSFQTVKTIQYGFFRSVSGWQEYGYDGDTKTGAVSYNADGTPAQISSYDADGIRHVETEYTYTDGILTTETVYHDNGNKSKQTTYDMSAHVLEQQEYDSAGQCTSWIGYEYDDSGNRTAELFYNTDGTVSQKVLYNSGGQKSGSIQYSYTDDRILTATEEYSEDAVLTKKTVWYQDGTVQSCQQYNSAGKLTESQEYAEDGTLTVWYRWEYESDGSYCQYQYDKDEQEMNRVYYKADGSEDFWRNTTYHLFGE